MLYEDLTHSIIGCYYSVYNKLGYGFLEKVYERALIIELQKLGFKATQQEKISVYYEDECVGEYYTDILVEDSVIVEIKAASSISDEHEAQLLNYLRATTMEVGLLLNFGTKPEFRRRVFTNEKK